MLKIYDRAYINCCFQNCKSSYVYNLSYKEESSSGYLTTTRGKALEKKANEIFEKRSEK